MKKRIGTNRIHSRILTSALIVLMGLGIGISCSKDTGVSSIDSTSTDDGVSSRRSVGTKPAVGSSNYADFHPQSGVNYDPFAGMSVQDRQHAIGGPEAAEKYLQIIVRQIALAMGNQKARRALYDAVPRLGQGEAHLAKIIVEHSSVLDGISAGFKDSVTGKSIGGELSNQAASTPSNGEAILKASKALFDLTLTVVAPSGKEWKDPSQTIPVFYMPMNDEQAKTMVGVNAKLEPVVYPFSSTDAPTAFLLLKFDEDSPMFDVGNESGLYYSPISQERGVMDYMFAFFSFTTPAFAHDDNPAHSLHHNLIQPAKKIIIYNDHEGIGSPEIFVVVEIRLTSSWVYKEKFDLKDVDNVGQIYTKYAYHRTDHTTSPLYDYRLVKVAVWERDDDWHNDLVCEWGAINGVYLQRVNADKTLYRYQASSNERDADLTIRRTDEE